MYVLYPGGQDVVDKRTIKVWAQSPSNGQLVNVGFTTSRPGKSRNCDEGPRRGLNPKLAPSHGTPQAVLFGNNFFSTAIYESVAEKTHFAHLRKVLKGFGMDLIGNCPHEID